jgi:hypothetical protein
LLTISQSLFRRILQETEEQVIESTGILNVEGEKQIKTSGFPRMTLGTLKFLRVFRVCPQGKGRP